MDGSLTQGDISRSSKNIPSLKRKLSENIKKENENDFDLKKKLDGLIKEVSEKEDILRKLNLVKLYKTKEEYSNLPELTQKWMDCCQQAVQDLYDLLPEPKPLMSVFMNNLNIKPSLLNYNEDEESFEP